MNKRDTYPEVMPAQRDPRGLAGQWRRFQRHWYGDPAPELAWLVERYWAATWDYRDQPPYRQLIVQYPNMHLSFQNGTEATVHGVARRHVVRTLAGAGRVFGVAFRPGCFRPLLGRAVSTLTDRSMPATALWGVDVPQAAMDAAVDEPAAVRVVETFLRRIAPPPDPVARQVAGIVARIAATRELNRVDELADRTGIGVRGLQRRFAEYVGAGPKWVIRRYRLHEVTQRMAGGAAIDWARVAAELGYADQAHLTRDFTAIVGESPTAYAQRYPGP
jgi:AraC-like DNA-binding protein